MGTASLVIGIGLIISAFYFIFYNAIFVPLNEDAPFGFLLLGIPLIVVGGLLLRKYDKDKKK